MVKAYETVKIEREGGITFVILNRPEKRNAMSPQLHMEMDEVLDELAVDEQTQVLVLTGAGEAFCAGQDIRLFFRGTDNDPVLRFKAKAASRSWRWDKLSRFPKPTIAMVNGYCFGGGFTQVCACDFAFAANEAVFGLSEVNWGILPGGIVSWVVAQTLNYRHALYYAVSGETFDGKRAVEIGFVNKSVPKKKLRAEVVAFAENLMTKSANSIRFTKEAIRTVRFMNMIEAEDYLNVKSAALQASDKGKGREQGMSQFLDDKSYRPGFGAFKDKEPKKPERRT